MINCDHIEKKCITSLEPRTKKYIIFGDPIPLSRPRMARSRVWDPQKKLKFDWGIQLNAQHNGEPLFVGPLRIEVIFYFSMEATPKKKHDLLRGTPHVFRPDLDNCIKFLCDCSSNDVLFRDDALICSITADKLYDDVPRTEFTIIELRRK